MTHERPESSSPGPSGGLLIASNRLPIRLEQNPDGTWRREPGTGGLVTALDPVLRREGGVWVGWPGVLAGDLPDVHEVLGRATGDDGYRVEPVPLTAQERRDFYLGFSNEILWPLCHGLQTRCRFEARYWEVYRQVNAKFAAAVDDVRDDACFVWVHDYHLMAVAEVLRQRGCGNRIGYFHHIPFPSPDTFEHLPWAEEVLHSLLDFDILGFQTHRDRKNFLACLEAMDVDARVVEGAVVRGPSGRWTRIGAFPISIDWETFHERAASPEVARRAEAVRADIRSELILLGVDRLDYTKGIPQKLAGFERALEKYGDLRGRVTLVQLVVPSRETIPEYEEQKTEIERTVGHINGRFTRGGWAPVLYQFDSWEQDELLAFYRAADVGLVTSLRDGMNLVSKEFVAASVDGRGALVLSAFAGSAAELSPHALLVNPHDVEAVADSIHAACTMTRAEQAERLAHMQERIHGYDVHTWVRSFLASARSSDGRVDGEVMESEEESIRTLHPPRHRPSFAPHSASRAGRPRGGLAG